MPRPSIFDDDWHDCLTEHYKQVVSTEGASRRTDTREVMEQIGYSKGDLSSLYIEATLHIDVLPEDFVPDAEMIEAQRQAAEQVHPMECQCPGCMPAPPRWVRQRDIGE